MTNLPTVEPLVWWTSGAASISYSKFGFYRIEQKVTFGHAIDHWDLTGPNGENLGTFLDPEVARETAQKDYEARAEPNAHMASLKADVNRARRCLERAILDWLERDITDSDELVLFPVEGLERVGLDCDILRGFLQVMIKDELVKFHRIKCDDYLSGYEFENHGFAITPNGRDYLRALELDGA